MSGPPMSRLAMSWPASLQHPQHAMRGESSAQLEQHACGIKQQGPPCIAQQQGCNGQTASLTGT